MPRQHLAGNLRVARFVRAEQTKVSEAEEEKKSAKAGEQQPVCDRLECSAMTVGFDVSSPKFGCHACFVRNRA